MTFCQRKMKNPCHYPRHYWLILNHFLIKTYFFYLPFLRDLRFEILNDTELHELLESLAGNDFRIFLFFFSFLTLIDSTDKLESEELSLLDCELKSEDTLNCVFLDLYFEIGICLPFSK